MEEAFGLHRMEKSCPKCAAVGIETFTVRIFPKNGQDVARCSRCNEWIKNLPRTETGKKQRSISTTHAGIKPAQRARILLRDNGRCVLCGRRESDGIILHVCHWISVEKGHKIGLSDDVINHDDNLFSGCEECNNGMKADIVPLAILVNVLLARLDKKAIKVEAIPEAEPVTFPGTDFDGNAWPIVFDDSQIP